MCDHVERQQKETSSLLKVNQAIGDANVSIKGGGEMPVDAMYGHFGCNHNHGQGPLDRQMGHAAGADGKIASVRCCAEPTTTSAMVVGIKRAIFAACASRRPEAPGKGLIRRRDGRRGRHRRWGQLVREVVQAEVSTKPMNRLMVCFSRPRIRVFASAVNIGNLSCLVCAFQVQNKCRPTRSRL